MGFPVSLQGTLRDINESSATKKHPLGTRLVMPDGRVFRYTKNGTGTLAIGKAVCAAAQLAAEKVDLELDVAATTAARNFTVGVTCTATGTTVAADKFNEGYMYVHVGTGAGQIVQLKDQAAGGSTAGATVKCYMDDESYLSVALDTSSSKLGLVKNPYDAVVVLPACTTVSVAAQQPVGVSPITVVLSRYFWLQTWGPCPVLMGTTPYVGEIVRAGSSTGAAGEVHERGILTTGTAVGQRADLPELGVVMAGNTDAEYALVYLTIAP